MAFDEKISVLSKIGLYLMLSLLSLTDIPNEIFSTLDYAQETRSRWCFCHCYHSSYSYCSVSEQPLTKE